MNDRLHAELDRWESVTQSLILTQSAPMVSAHELTLCFEKFIVHDNTSRGVHSCHRPLTSIRCHVLPEQAGILSVSCSMFCAMEAALS